MIIRIAEPADIDAIDAIYNQAIELNMATADTVPYSREERELWFESHNNEEYPLYVAVLKEMVVAYCYFSAYRPRRHALRYAAEISYFVHEEFRRQGIGSALMNHLVTLAPGLGFKTLLAILLEHNTGSISLLEKYGFREWGRIPSAADFNGREYDHLYYGFKITD